MDQVHRSLNIRTTYMLRLGYSSAQGVILVYAVTSRLSFDMLEVFRQSMLRAAHSPIFMLVGNKCDKAQAELREVLKEEGAALARLFG